VKRTGSGNRHFVCPIPSDVRSKAVGRKLSIPVGEQTQTVTLSSRAQSVRLSLRTGDPVEVKLLGAVALRLHGARVGELVQLRKEDIPRDGAHWIAKITPDAGTGRTNEARHVVLHKHLAEIGFAAFVKEAASGHLFLTPSSGGGVLGPFPGVKNRIAEFVRTLVSDKSVAPSHG